MPKKPVVAVPRMPMPDVVARLERDYQLRLNRENNVLTSDALLAFCQNVDAVLPCPSEQFDSRMIAALPERVKIIACHSVGVDNIDLDAARTKGITVTNTPDVLNDATAEIAILLMLAAARRAGEGERIIRNRAWDHWGIDFMIGKQVTGARLGIVGMGRIGQIMARRARAFDMEIHYHNRRRLPPEQEQGATWHETLESLLPVSDFLSLHCPATPETWHLMNAERLALLPEGAVLVNTARGTAVDDTALIAALKSGQLAAAGLDVFEGEPRVNPGYLTLENAFLLPHIGSATHKTRVAMGARAVDNLDAYFSGKVPPDRIV